MVFIKKVQEGDFNYAKICIKSARLSGLIPANAQSNTFVAEIRSGVVKSNVLNAFKGCCDQNYKGDINKFGCVTNILSR